MTHAGQVERLEITQAVSTADTSDSWNEPIYQF